MQVEQQPRPLHSGESLRAGQLGLPEGGPCPRQSPRTSRGQLGALGGRRAVLQALSAGRVLS